MSAGHAVDLGALSAALAEAARAGYEFRVREEEAESEAAFRHAGRNLDRLSRLPLRHAEVVTGTDAELRAAAVERERRSVERFRADHERRYAGCQRETS